MTVFVVMFLAVLAVMCIRMASKQDPRSYVLLRERNLREKSDSFKYEEVAEEVEETASKGLWLRNSTLFDVKVLCFDRSDRVFFIPKGGLLPKNAVIRSGHRKHFPDAPLTAKIFAPFETDALNLLSTLKTYRKHM